MAPPDMKQAALIKLQNPSWPVPMRSYSLGMHGAPSGPGNAGAEPTVEGLDSVLSRFQDWSRTRNDGPAAKGGSVSRVGRGTSAKKANLTAGARELSYEQALRASSYRRQVYQTPAQGAPAQTASAETAPIPPAVPVAEMREFDSVATAAPRVSSESAAEASVARLPKVPNDSVSRTGRRTRMAASAVVVTAADAVGATAASQRATTTEVPEQLLVKRRKATSSRGSRIVQPAPVQTAAVRPAFREVLQESAGLAAKNKDAALANKTVALSLRVSDAEQACIQACAARANASVSAYLRQCALGVEELRDQVELALGELRKQDVQKSAPVGLSAIPGILRHAAAGWFRRLRGNSDYTGISLR